jgi:glucokinase
MIATTNVRHATTDQLYVGVDVGGSKVAVLVVDAALTPCARLTVPTPVVDAAGAASRIAAAVRETLDAVGLSHDRVAGVGIGIPGRVDPERGVVSLAVNLGWHELALASQLSALLGVPCRIENDVRAAAAGLHRRRVLGDVESLAFVGIGTGIACGVVLGGKLHRGVNGLAGETGHIVLEPEGPACRCGLRGCFEAMAAGPAIAAHAARHIARGDHSLLTYGAAVSAEDVYAAAARGDEVALHVAEEAGGYVARAVHDLAMAYDVERVVLGGGVTHAGDTFFAPVVRALERMRSESELVREVVRDGLVELLPAGSEPGAWGAAALARWGPPESTTAYQRGR